MRYALWNNKGGVGKTFLSFILSTQMAKRKPDGAVLVVDMCPQANLSEILLGGGHENRGPKNLDNLIEQRKTIGGYFDQRIGSPHKKSGNENEYIIKVNDYNKMIPENIFLIAGDSSLELQAQVINQISGQSLPKDSWKNVHFWLRDIIEECTQSLKKDCAVFVDCNPSFSAYTELSIIGVDKLIIPCSSDGSSARAIDNVGTLVYGLKADQYKGVDFSSKAKSNNLNLPIVHSIIFNRSTQFDNKASKAFAAMFENIKSKVQNVIKDVNMSLSTESEAKGMNEPKYVDMPDSHSVSIICSHYGIPLFDLKSKKYPVHGKQIMVNKSPLERYTKSVEALIKLF